MAAPHPYNTRAASALRQAVASSHASTADYRGHELGVSQDEARKRRRARKERKAASRRRKRQFRELQAHKRQRASTEAEIAPAAPSPPTPPIAPAAADISRAPISETGTRMNQGYARGPITQPAPVPHIDMSERHLAPSPESSGTHSYKDPDERSWPPQSYKDQMQEVAAHLHEMATAVTGHPLTFAANLNPDALIGSLHRALQICETARAIVKPMSIPEPARIFGPTLGAGPTNKHGALTTRRLGGGGRHAFGRHDREGAPEPPGKRMIKHEPVTAGEHPTRRKSRLEVDPERGKFMIETGPGGRSRLVEVPLLEGESLEAYQKRFEELRLSNNTSGK